MWDITAETKALALAPVRHIWCRAIFGTRSGNTWTNDRNYYGTDKIVSAVVDIGTKSGGIQVGNAFCGKLTLLLLDGVEIHQSDRIIMRVGFYKPDGSRSEEISLGWYYVDTVKKSNGIYTVTAYDKMLRAHKNYNSKLTYPAKMSAVLLELCDLLDVNLASDFAIPYDGTISEKPAKGTDSDGNTIYYTRREMLSYLASAMGGNFFFDAGGHLQLTRFATVEDSFAAANSIEADISDDSYSVNGIVWSLGGVTYSRNDEDTNGIMEFENPLTFYPKEPVQHAIEERVTGLNYHEATIRRQGCGWFELGDIVTAYRADGTSTPVLITGLNYSIADGGFAEKIYSSARSSSQDNYTTGDIVGQSVPQSVGGAVQSSSGTAEKLQTTGSKYWAVTDDSGVSFGADNSGKIAFLTKQGTGTGFRLGAYAGTGMEFKGSGLGAIKLYDQSDGNCLLYVESGAEYPINICTGDTTQGDHTSFRVYNGGKLKVYPDSLTIQTELRTTLTLKITSDGWSLGTTGKMLEAKADGLYFNGKKVLLEG